MKKVTFKLVFECDDNPKVETTLQEYVERYLINEHTLEFVRLRMIAADELPHPGYEIHSMKIEKETKKETKNVSKKRKPKKPV